MALVVALLTMVVLTFLGLAAVNTSTFDNMISGNYKSSTRALAAAEAGVQEVIARMNLRNNASVTIANGGSKVDPAVNGVTNAYIGDSISSPDFNWQTRIFLTSSDPTDSGSIVNTSSLLSSSDWSNLNYTETSTAYASTALTVKHATESDLGLDLDSDSGTDLPVYYSRTAGRNVTGTGSLVDLITCTGRSGDARRTIQVELCSFPIIVNPSAAVTVGLPPTWTGSAFISGFDHQSDTVSTDDASGTFGGIQNNGVDNYGGQSSDSDTSTVNEPEPDVDYFAKLTGNTANYLPGAASNGSAIGVAGSMDVFGGNNTVPWKNEALPTWQTLSQLLGITVAELNDILAQATVTEADMGVSGILGAAPQGIIYIDNAGGNELKITSATPSSGDGYGLMYVTGDAQFQDFTFKGLIYIEGDASITGNFWMAGAFVNKGVTSSFAAGNGTFLYSRDILLNLKQYVSHTILSWREL